MGIRLDVCLAAMMPARRATSSGSPLGLRGRAFSTAGLRATKALASAWRRVIDFELTSTMRALPLRSKWESLRGMKSSILQGDEAGNSTFPGQSSRMAAANRCPAVIASHVKNPGLGGQDREQIPPVWLGSRVGMRTGSGAVLRGSLDTMNLWHFDRLHYLSSTAAHSPGWIFSRSGGITT